jgi:hypothetical protein
MPLTRFDPAVLMFEESEKVNISSTVTGIGRLRFAVFGDVREIIGSGGYKGKSADFAVSKIILYCNCRSK